MPSLFSRIALNPTLSAIALVIASSVCIALMHALIRLVSEDVDPIQIAFLRNAFGLIVFVPILWSSGFGIFRTRRPGLHAARAVLNVMAMFAFFTALSLTEVAKVTALGFTAPIYTALLSVIVLGERFRLRRWSAILIGFAGMLIILRPGIVEIDLGSALVLGSAVLWGIVMLLIKYLGRTESSLTITAYMNVGLSILSFVPALFVWSNPPLMVWALLVIIGVIGTAGQLALAEALKRADATFVLPFDFLRLIWAAGFGYLLFAEIPDTYTWIGGAVIFASTFYLAYRERQKTSRPAGEERVDAGG